MSRYYIPPQYYPFLKKLGDDTPELKHLVFMAFVCLLVAVAGRRSQVGDPQVF